MHGVVRAWHVGQCVPYELGVALVVLCEQDANDPTGSHCNGCNGVGDERQNLSSPAHIFMQFIATPSSFALIRPSETTVPDELGLSPLNHYVCLPMTCMAVKLSSFPLARARLNPIAPCLAGAGYRAFGVWAHDVAIEYWPAGAVPPAPDVVADVPGAFARHPDRPAWDRRRPARASV